MKEERSLARKWGERVGAATGMVILLTLFLAAVIIAVWGLIALGEWAVS